MKNALFALFVWSTVVKKNQDLNELERDILLEQRISHLYLSNTKAHIEKLCKDHGISVKSQSKHELVKLLAEKKKETMPDVPILYTGDIASIPETLPAINKLTVRKLRAILHHHGILTCGAKEQLAIRVYLLKHDKHNGLFYKERKLLHDHINIAEELIFQELQLNIRSSLRSRTYGPLSKTTRNLRGEVHYERGKTPIPPPPGIDSLQELTNLFQPLKRYINIVHSAQEEKRHASSTCKTITSSVDQSPAETLHDQVIQIGAIVKIQWKKDDVRDSGWKPGWYKAQVQSFNLDTDEIDVSYVQEPNCVYTHEVGPMITTGAIKLIKSVYPYLDY